MIRESFSEKMANIESRIETWVRIGGPDRDRISGNAVYAWFVRRETRPIDGMGDPHFHIHAYVFDATFDSDRLFTSRLPGRNLVVTLCWKSRLRQYTLSVF